MITARGSILSLLLSTACVVEYSVVEGDTGGSSDGTAADDCPGTSLRCGEACVEPSADPEHCGGCGQACAAGTVCNQGECEDECSEGLTECARACVDLDEDPLHCGRCGETCDLDGACVQGDCIDGCNDACNEAQGEICVGGECECRPELATCSGQCVDLQSNPDHCGECDEDCEEGPCGGGECLPEGCGALTDCDGACVDISSHPLHCGECDRVCDRDETCTQGECEDGD